MRVADHDHDPFAVLEDQPLLAPAADSGGSGIVGGGWFGYLGYRLAGRVEVVGASPPRCRELPDFELAFYDHLVRLDAAGRWWFEALWTAARGPAIAGRLSELNARVGLGARRPRAFSTTAWTATPGPQGHARAVEAARERIRAGDLFQANLARRLSARLTGEPVDVFGAAVPRLRPDRAAWLGGPWGEIVSLSPELFLERHGREVRSAPIKGTAPRGSAIELGQDAGALARPVEADEIAADRALAAELWASAKDRAENVMIVDLVRNDLGRVCEPGSIRVAALAEPRAHAGVWHLVSEIVGRVAAGVGDGALVRAAFPPGSVTGAPKLAAVEVISELESAGREVYTGAVGFAGPLAGLELSVAIRTLEFSGAEAWLGVGGGIVADSDPLAELAECVTKVEPVIAAIGGRLAVALPGEGEGEAVVGALPGETVVGALPGEAVDAAPRPARIGGRPLPRPDRRAGVFETILVRDCRAVALGWHVARIGASVDALYGRRPDPGVARLVAQAAAARLGGPARLRLTVRPGAGALEVDIRTSELSGGRPPVALRTMTLAGGLGAHKWVDRRLIDAFERYVWPEQPLFCDADGRLLEASRSNVFIVEADGALVTPPVDGRLLPGVTRGRIMRLAGRLGMDLRVEEISVGRLRRAAEVFVSGSLGGVEAVASCDARQLDPAGPVTLALSRGLAPESVAEPAVFVSGAERGVSPPAVSAGRLGATAGSVAGCPRGVSQPG